MAETPEANGASPSSSTENGATSSSSTANGLSDAEQLKNEANQTFKDKHFTKAVDLYTQAIELTPGNAILYANRAAAHVRLENYGSALADATSAIDKDPKYIKGYYRRADANLGLGKVRNALNDFRRAAKEHPRDPDLRKKLEQCEREVKRLRFKEALATPNEVPVAQQIDLSSMPVEDSYDGPRMEGSEEEGYRLTRDFITAMMEHFRRQKTIHKRFAFQIILEATELLRKSPSLVDVAIPAQGGFTVCGDVHGQFYDLLHIFELNGLPSEENPYLFNGDFVDRGSFSVEVILTLMAWRVLLPKHMHMARGNHESKGMNKIYGFEGEVKAKYNATMAELFREAFCWLPLAHCLNGKVLVLHGGLFSRDGVTLDDLRAIDRCREPPEEGLMCELLWSDPQAQDGRSPSKRGVGVAFGPDVTQRFLEANGLQLLIRSHEVKEEGYEVEHNGYCITVFSAPNYCDQMGNKGAFIRFKGADMAPNFTTYPASPHPNVRPMAYASSFMGGIFGG
ncbi:hypothetical protein WJX81_001775 [Elliptochloris bilobata]|uniref:protein-serine/threonine phosphatase n=1 Tax=Elliptochloris bilobata TaxID=381761 RepID=A0AAW1SBV1_9CHLO